MDVLRQGLEALPGDRQISLLLARILDQQRERGASLELLARLEGSGWREESPRERYDNWVPEGVEQGRSNHLEATSEGIIALEFGLTRPVAEAEGR